MCLYSCGRKMECQLAEQPIRNFTFIFLVWNNREVVLLCIPFFLLILISRHIQLLAFLLLCTHEHIMLVGNEVSLGKTAVFLQLQLIRRRQDVLRPALQRSLLFFITVHLWNPITSDTGRCTSIYLTEYSSS